MEMFTNITQCCFPTSSSENSTQQRELDDSKEKMELIIKDVCQLLFCFLSHVNLACEEDLNVVLSYIMLRVYFPIHSSVSI